MFTLLDAVVIAGVAILVIFLDVHYQWSLQKWQHGVILVALFGVYLYIKQTIRAWRVAKVAGKFKLKVDPDASQVELEDYSQAPLLNDESADYANWFRKHIDGLRVDVFDYTCRKMTQTGKADMSYVITAVRSHHGHRNSAAMTPFHWPAFAIRPRGVGKRFLEFFGLHRIGMFVDLHPRFAKRHILTSPYESATEVVFDDSLRNHLATLSDLHLCSAGPWLVIRHGPGYTPLPPRKIPQAIALAVAIYQQFPPLEEVGIPAPEPVVEMDKEDEEDEDYKDDFPPPESIRRP